MSEKNIVTAPIISEETLNEMKKFFLTTSIPRIMKENSNQPKGA
jgi:hypothetical protein